MARLAPVPCRFRSKTFPDSLNRLEMTSNSAIASPPCTDKEAMPRQIVTQSQHIPHREQRQRSWPWAHCCAPRFVSAACAVF